MIYHLRPIEKQSETRYELKIKCSELNIKKSIASVSELEDGHVLYDRVDSTEQNKTNKSKCSDYQKTIFVDFNVEEKKTIIFQIHNEKITSDRWIGEFKTTMGNILSRPNCTIIGDIVNTENKVQCKIEVFAKPIRNSYKLLSFGIEVKNIDSKDWNGKSDPYYILYNQSALVYKSEIKEKTLDAKFYSKELPLEIFNGGEMDRELMIEIYDHNSINDDELIGIVRFNSKEIIGNTDRNPNSFDLPIINPDKKYKPGYKNSGYLNFYHFEIKNKLTEKEKEENLQKIVSENPKYEFLLSK